MKSGLTLLFLLSLSTSLFCCDRLRHKGKLAVRKVEDKAANVLRSQIQKAVVVVFPPFDHARPDTENNKIRFKDFIQVELTPDVENIYCFDDPIGIDQDYMFAFNCDSTTSQKIIQKHQLILDTLHMGNGSGMQHDFEWWDKKRIEQLPQYSWTNGKQYYKFYWYDAQNRKAYFFDFDM